MELPGLHMGAATRWQAATVVGRRRETASAKTFRLRLDEPFTHRPGQHVVVRLTAPDGYKASRAYSIASAPGGGDEIAITVERLADGEVSAFLHDEVEPGDALEVRGPIGAFVWEGGTPAVLVGGGSGVVPLMAMLRHARRRRYEDLVRLVVSVRGEDDLYYKEEISGPETTVVYTRSPPPGATRPPGRLRAADLGPAVEALGGSATAYVCGSSGFVESAGLLLIDAGVDARLVRTERFGPTS